jgi:hypothetical protein
MDTTMTQLQSRLAAKIATVAAVTPALTMPTPRFVFDEEELNWTNNDPIVQIIDRRTRTRYEDLAGRWVDQEYTIEVAIFVRAMRADLQRLLRRYTRCIIEVLLDAKKTDAWTPYDLRIRDQEIDRSPLSIVPAPASRSTAVRSLLTRGMFIPLVFNSRGQERYS